MAAIPDKPELPPEITERMEAIGIAPTLGNLQDIITEWRANTAKIAEYEREVAQREKSWPLKGLLPVHISDEVGRVAAVTGKLIAHQPGGKGSPWRATVNAVEDWLRDGRWFKSTADEMRWRASVKIRTSQG